MTKISAKIAFEIMERGGSVLPKGEYDDELGQEIADRMNFHADKIKEPRTLVTDYLWGELSRTEVTRQLSITDESYYSY